MGDGQARLTSSVQFASVVGDSKARNTLTSSERFAFNEEVIRNAPALQPQWAARHGSAVAPGIVHSVRASDPVERGLAALNIASAPGVQGDHRALVITCKMCYDEDIEVRKAALLALGETAQVGEPLALETLVERLQDEVVEIRVAALHEIVKLVPAKETSVIRHCQSILDKFEELESAVQFGSSSTFTPALKGTTVGTAADLKRVGVHDLHHALGTVQVQVTLAEARRIFALAPAGRDAKAAFLDLKDAIAREALSTRVPDCVLSGLIGALGDPARAVRGSASKMLRQVVDFGDARAVQRLCTAVAAGRGSLYAEQLAAVKDVCERGDQSVIDAVCVICDDPREAMRVQALDLLAAMCRPRDQELFRRCARLVEEDVSMQVRQRAEALQRSLLGPLQHARKGAGDIDALLDSSEVLLRRRGARLAGQGAGLRSAARQEKLAEVLLNDPDLGVRREAMQSLVNICPAGDQRAVDALQSTLRTEADPNQRVRIIETLAAHALAGTRSVVVQLLEVACKESDKKVRLAAAQNLGSVVDFADRGFLKGIEFEAALRDRAQEVSELVSIRKIHQELLQRCRVASNVTTGVGTLSVTAGHLLSGRLRRASS